MKGKPEKRCLVYLYKDEHGIERHERSRFAKTEIGLDRKIEEFNFLNKPFKIMTKSHYEKRFGKIK